MSKNQPKKKALQIGGLKKYFIYLIGKTALY